MKIWGIYVFGGLTMPKYLFFRDLILKTISSLKSDLKKLIYEWSNFRFPEDVVPLGWDHTIRFFAQFSGINRVKRRASPLLTIAGTCHQLH